MSRSRILSATLCLALASTAAFATDGVIEINQARANAGGVTTGDTAGFPVTISKSGSYRLTSNLSIGTVTGQGISVTAPNVTIDLNGFAIIGPVVCTEGTPTTCNLAGGLGAGIIAAANIDRVTVRNGTITGMGGNAVDLNAFSRVENIHASQNTAQGILTASDSVIVGCITDLNGAAGIFSDTSLIQNCISRSNASSGIVMNGSGVISGCNSRRNGSSGISSSGGLVTGSTAIANASFGLTSGGAYSNCVFSLNNGANPEVSGGVQIGTNVCNGAACP